MRDLTQESGYFPPFGFGFLQLVKNSQGKAIDCIFLEISNGLQRMIGLQRDDIKGRRASDIISSKDNFDWTDYFNTALASGKICEISRRIDSIDRECNVIVVPSNKDCFTLIIQEIKKTLILTCCLLPWASNVIRLKSMYAGWKIVAAGWASSFSLQRESCKSFPFWQFFTILARLASIPVY